jgi:mannose-6-phosphate isomerase
MPARRLTMHRVEKPWGRRVLWGDFVNPGDDEDPVGEIWFQDDQHPAAELLVKYLFTSERLSIQVHPDDAAARAAGHPRGKDEAWVVLDAAPDSTIAIGTRSPIDRATLRTAAEDGSIEALMDWRPVRAGDVFYSPAGTVHAIGAGITLVEVQQNVDLTYRLYDYGHPRQLHLDDGIAVSDAQPFEPNFVPEQAWPGRTILCEGPKFVLERWTLDFANAINLPNGVPGWFIPLAGAGKVDGALWAAGEVWRIDGRTALEPSQASEALLAYPLARRLALTG